ncbi:hypothetical protein ABLO07_15060, partial [Mycobacterium tuberculosis]
GGFLEAVNHAGSQQVNSRYSSTDGTPNAAGTPKAASPPISAVDDYTVTPTSYVVGIAAEPLSGQFDDDGAVSASVAITVARSVPSGYYPIYVTTSAGDSARTLIVLVVVAEAVE